MCACIFSQLSLPAFHGLMPHVRVNPHLSTVCVALPVLLDGDPNGVHAGYQKHKASEDINQNDYVFQIGVNLWIFFGI